jgi:hypothetical protein
MEDRDRSEPRIRFIHLHPRVWLVVVVVSLRLAI